MHTREEVGTAVETAQDLEASFAWAPPLSTKSLDADDLLAGPESVSPDDIAAEFAALEELKRTEELASAYREGSVYAQPLSSRSEMTVEAEEKKVNVAQLNLFDYHTGIERSTSACQELTWTTCRLCRYGINITEALVASEARARFPSNTRFRLYIPASYLQRTSYHL
ncbi:hypothetical protein DFJ58DRAFT_728435 [Suillus subalutaceus]|uniref:uncharacterized protein n=1 Tax=Suillus subalutaceus TaxID=48586 RepID=UPI001B885A72|nr:uncharacterized protein DFJ58DRAFT_728435 [Suillus subalutaceus]KAG1852779.1 hypothetical protein DFJ58DRAFT_728435 [Suillus subalutaceus]